MNILTHYPKRLTIQWHITDRCNLRYRHCYQDSYTDKGLPLNKLSVIAKQIFTLRQTWSNEGYCVPLTFTITGEEPCSHPDFKAFLEILAKHPSKPAIGILSNGGFIDEDLADFLANLKVTFVHLSIEGCLTTQNTIRGKHNFSEVIRTSRLLQDKQIPVIWSFTAHSENFHEFPEVAHLAQYYHIDRIWSDRMIPTCQENAPLALTNPQTTAYLQFMYNAFKKQQEKPNKTHVALARALQFLVGEEAPYYCKAGSELITIMPNAELHPCRRLPISVGNLLQTPLAELYNHPLMQKLRNFSAPDSCSPCLYKTFCKGGLRCLAYAINGDIFSPDPGCIALK